MLLGCSDVECGADRLGGERGFDRDLGGAERDREVGDENPIRVGRQGRVVSLWQGGGTIGQTRSEVVGHGGYACQAEALRMEALGRKQRRGSTRCQRRFKRIRCVDPWRPVVRPGGRHSRSVSGNRRNRHGRNFVEPERSGWRNVHTAFPVGRDSAGVNTRINSRAVDPIRGEKNPGGLPVRQTGAESTGKLRFS